ncbi:uncharacterized protein TRAVEDRAFT_164034 [Trametes versicolor FP-101664 SS1]|uniref:uncharacterized protein n=1 Tax=Trametes versicolor (strain FP-101664) TaxID=717944 RepID=UPI00046216C4|nr:uncharacterized protein TRAVEDRAFT_164034 [Trametes versicolor FP-101664 SS1]EIW62192.1 hypothetical protein TRAVEDRAFT_164034 [Trametes versicolor FP-101664 SS1]
MVFHCQLCPSSFYWEDELFEHEDDFHPICGPCNKRFSSQWGLTQHYVQSPRHAYCQKCRRLFPDWSALYSHYDEQHYYCSVCSSIFDFEVGLHEHRRQKHANLYCVPCKRMFQNANNLDSHRRSSIHQGRTVQCPMQGCKGTFVSTAALVLHLESGACVSRMTRDAVNRIVVQVDRSNIITNPARLITGAPTSGGTTVTATWATQRAWNGTHYECYLCHRGYKSLHALNQHLQSSAHAEKMYRCPQGWSGCGAEFGTLSAFCQHVEGGKCGVRRFQGEFNRVMGQLSSGMKQLTMGS